MEHNDSREVVVDVDTNVARPGVVVATRRVLVEHDTRAKQFGKEGLEHSEPLGARSRFRLVRRESEAATTKDVIAVSKEPVVRHLPLFDEGANEDRMDGLAYRREVLASLIEGEPRACGRGASEARRALRCSSTARSACEETVERRSPRSIPSPR